MPSLKLLTREDIPEDALTVSPTQVQLFDRCNYKWHLTHQEKAKEFTVATGKMQLGSMAHLLLQEYYRHFLHKPVENLDSQQLTDLMEKVQAENGLTDYDSQLLFFNAYTVFITYMRWAERSERLIPLGVEVETFAPTGLVTAAKYGRRPIYLHGIIDLHAENKGGVPGIADHKTHTNRPWTSEQILFDTQMLFYPLLLGLQGAECEWTMINTLNMYLPKKDVTASLQREERFQRFLIKTESLNVQRYQEELFKIIEKMWCTPGYKYTRRLDRYCSGCGFAEICGSHLRGFDTDELIETKFSETTMKVEEFDAESILEGAEGSYPSLP